MQMRGSMCPRYRRSGLPKLDHEYTDCFLCATFSPQLWAPWLMLQFPSGGGASSKRLKMAHSLLPFTVLNVRARQRLAVYHVRKQLSTCFLSRRPLLLLCSQACLCIERFFIDFGHSQDPFLQERQNCGTCRKSCINQTTFVKWTGFIKDTGTLSEQARPRILY